MLQLPTRKGTKIERHNLAMAIADTIQNLADRTGFKFGARGWAYYCEGLGMITKGQFDQFEALLTRLRKDGFLDLNVIEPDAARLATDVFDPDAEYSTPEEQAAVAVQQIGPQLESWARAYYENGYWDGLAFYVEMIVEKKDLLQIFGNVANELRVRVTNGRGDTDIHSRASMLKRFREHAEAGRQPVLLVIGDHDPKGLLIAEDMKKTVLSVKDAVLDGEPIWPDADFTVDHIGLTEQQIDDWGLMRLDNLETSGGKDLSSPGHPDHDKPYVQDYIDRFGVWKVEANALVAHADQSVEMFRDAVAQYIPVDHTANWRAANAPAQQQVRDHIELLMQSWTFGD